MTITVRDLNILLLVTDLKIKRQQKQKNQKKYRIPEQDKSKGPIRQIGATASTTEE